MKGCEETRSTANRTDMRDLKIVNAKPWDLERVKGIEPSLSAWEAAALPLSYTRALRWRLTFIQKVEPLLGARLAA